MLRFAAPLTFSLIALSHAGAAPKPRTETAIFAGGCFWCMEAQFEGLPGVLDVFSGYTGGHKQHPTYEEVCAHTTGHLEAIRVTFDPAVIPYQKLLERFWRGVDPTQTDGQFCDLGDSYGTAIFTLDARQHAAALASKAALERSRTLEAPVVTRIEKAGVFWPAEEYHQDFARRNPERYRAYRTSCARDRRLKKLWGAEAATHPEH